MVKVSVCALFCLLPAAGQANQPTLLQFTADWCGACRAVEPTVQRLVAEGYPVQRIDIDRDRETAARFRVTAVPSFVLVHGGREADRLVGGASYARLVQMFERTMPPAGGTPPADTAPLVRGQSPGGSGLGLPRPLAALARGLRDRSNAGPDRAMSPEPDQPGAPLIEHPPAGPTGAPSGMSAVPSLGGPAYPPSTPPGYATAVTPAGRPVPAAVQGLDSPVVQGALQSTVRLRVADSSGHSLGTGTMIDVHGQEALVVTCAHIFRASQGKGAIEVDLFAPQARTVRGTLISSDMDRDVAMVAIVPGMAVQVARVAPPSTHVVRQQTVFSIGCDKGAPPTVRPSSITAIDRYTGAPNIEVAGMPVDGRSGGGLFLADGLLIGVCNAADPADQEGIFASLPNIHWELDKIGQRAVYDPRGSTGLAQTPRPPARQAAPVTPGSTASAPAVASALPAEMPRSGLAIQPMPAAAGDDTEIICIVRSRANPHGSERLLVLDRPSRGLLDKLALEFQQSASAMARQTAPGRPPARTQPVSPDYPRSPIIRAQSDEP
ncbi:MAG: trypsin-like peptidase domain-containing protein [Pirellulaceae bacterium]